MQGIQEELVMNNSPSTVAKHIRKYLQHSIAGLLPLRRMGRFSEPLPLLTNLIIHHHSQLNITNLWYSIWSFDFGITSVWRLHVVFPVQNTCSSAMQLHKVGTSFLEKVLGVKTKHCCHAELISSNIITGICTCIRKIMEDKAPRNDCSICLPEGGPLESSWPRRSPWLRP